MHAIISVSIGRHVTCGGRVWVEGWMGRCLYAREKGKRVREEGEGEGNKSNQMESNYPR